MMISKNTQLGLQFVGKIGRSELILKLEAMQLRLESIERAKAYFEASMSEIENLKRNEDGTFNFDDTQMSESEKERFSYELSGYATFRDDEEIIEQSIRDRVGEDSMGEGLQEPMTGKLFLITEGVRKPSEMIKMSGFASTALSRMKEGAYIYLLGKTEMCRFVVRNGAIMGFHWDRSARVCYDFQMDLTRNFFSCDYLHRSMFSRLAQIITFVELGDIEVVEIEGGKNNGKPKNEGKIHNAADYKVYIVDSSWNQLIIRTTGFAVRGHFRLQPCGAGMADRKLIWIDAFEKHGYIRRPKGQIVG